jgi:protein TonB
VLLAACARSDRAALEREAAENRNVVPVAINDESPFQYPPALYDEGVEGEVRLRLFVDSAGRVVPESTRVASPSGAPALDSAAAAGAALLRFAPARRNGVPVGMAFYQPVIFSRRAAPGSPDSAVSKP